MGGDALASASAEQLAALWRQADNCIDACLSGMKAVGQLLAYASESPNAGLGHTELAPVGWLISHLSEEIEACRSVTDAAEQLISPEGRRRWGVGGCGVCSHE